MNQSELDSTERKRRATDSDFSDDDILCGATKSSSLDHGGILLYGSGVAGCFRDKLLG